MNRSVANTSIPTAGARQLLPYSALSQHLSCRTAKLRIELKKTIFRATSLQTRQLSLGDTSGLVRRQALLKCSLGFPFWFTEVTNKKILIYWALWQNWEKLSLAWSCLSVRPHGTARLPLKVFSCNLIFEYFSMICPENTTSISIWREWKEIYMKTRTHLWSHLAEFFR